MSTSTSNVGYISTTATARAYDRYNEYNSDNESMPDFLRKRTIRTQNNAL